MHSAGHVQYPHPQALVRRSGRGDKPWSRDFFPARCHCGSQLAPKVSRLAMPTPRPPPPSLFSSLWSAPSYTGSVTHPRPRFAVERPTHTSHDLHIFPLARSLSTLANAAPCASFAAVHPHTYNPSALRSGSPPWPIDTNGLYKADAKRGRRSPTAHSAHYPARDNGPAVRRTDTPCLAWPHTRPI